MTTSTITEMARAAIMESPRRAQFESYLTRELTPGLAGAILRQLKCTETDETTVGYLPRERRNTTGSTGTGRPDWATDRQRDYAVDLLKTRLAPGEAVIGTVKTAEQVIAMVTACGQMHRKLARDVIDFYKDRARLTEMVKRIERPAPAAKAAPVELVAGMYRVGDDWFKVQKSRQSGWMYAKRLVVHSPGQASFEYDSGAIRGITPEHRVTLEEAQQFGHAYGVCLSCGALLTDPVSVAQGIGPICAKRF